MIIEYLAVFRFPLDKSPIDLSFGLVNNQFIYSATKIFTGESWVTGHAIVANSETILGLVPVSSLSSLQAVTHFDECIIAPAYIDLQIYGAHGKLLAVYPDIDALQKLRSYCEDGGAAYCLPTVATNTKEVFFQCIDAVRKYWEHGGNGILGLHLEGPWINPLKRGAHIENLVHNPDIKEVKEMLDYGSDVIKIITLAPEVCSDEIILEILSRGILISAGHSNATYDQAKTSFTKGITAVTHLYNAMSPLLHREPGLCGAAMDDKNVMASIIADGHHVDYAAIRIAKQVMKERLFLITDAVTDTTEGHYKHTLVSDKYESANILSGSSLTMAAAVRNLVNFAFIETGEAIRMASTYPAKLMGLDNLGTIQKGKSSRMVVLDQKLEVKKML